jgi:pilus assembly protein CpaB
MNARSLLIVVAALLVAGVTAFLARGWLSTQRAQMETQQVVEVQHVPAQAVLVAAANLPTGLFIKEEHLRWQAWPSDAVDPNYLLQEKTDIATVVGAVVRRGISAGEPIVAGKVVKPGDRGFLAAVLKPGMRAVTFGISEISGLAGMVFPGDRVDMLLTHELPGTEEQEGEARRASETVLENVRVLAIGQRLDDQAETPVEGKTATIEVTPKQAEMVAVLVELGRISLALRSLADEQVEASAQLLMSSDSPEAETAPEQPAGGSLPATALPPAGATATAAGDGAAAAAETDVAEPAPPMDDNPAATRGQTYTYDSEVSRLLTPNGGMLVQRGSETQKVTFQ